MHDVQTKSFMFDVITYLYVCINFMTCVYVYIFLIQFLPI